VKPHALQALTKADDQKRRGEDDTLDPSKEIYQLNWTTSNYSKHGTTGIAATNIRGTTLQNWRDGLGFFGDSFHPLSTITLGKFQEHWKDCKMIIIDEYSMLRQKELHFANERLKQIMCSDLPFGGLVVVLVGDPAQLPPVKGKCLWDKKPRNQSKDWCGYQCYRLFTTAMKLTESNRLDPNDVDSVFYGDFLDRLRDGENTTEDWQYFCQLGSRDTIGERRWKERGFDDPNVVHLYTTNKEVSRRNNICLQKVGEPIVRIDAAHSGKGRQATTNQAGGLVPVLFLCINASVMLTKNVAQNAGLCNGATGKVIAIIYGSAASAPGLPLYTIVDFGSGYSGSPFFGDDPAKSSWVPIFPESSEWYTPHASNPNEMLKHSRTMLPLRLCYAWTVWKVQGQTLKGKVVASLGTKEAEHGLTYTVFSRVTKASDLGIIGGFPKDRLITKVAKNSKMVPRQKEERRLDGIVTQTKHFLRNLEVNN
jgi:hypothetical protein